MRDDEADAIVRTIRIKARPETVFAFLIEPGRMRRWIGKVVELDPRPGGLVRIDANGRDVIRGTFLEIDPPRKIVFTWGWEGKGRAVPPGSTTVEITLEPDGDHTVLTLRHRGLRGEDREKHAFGWTHYTTRLQQAAEGRDPGPDPLATPDIVHG